MSEPEQRRRVAARLATELSSIFELSEEDLGNGRSLFQVPGPDELGAGQIDTPPAGYDTWRSWAAERWPSWREPPFRTTAFRPLVEMCDQWAEECERWVEERPRTADPGLMREGIALFRALPREATRQVLLCTDLHAENILASEREPWLVIDPKPYVGDPTYDALQHILNRRLMDDPASRVETMARLLDLEVERLSWWLFARCVVGAPSRPELLVVAERLVGR